MVKFLTSAIVCAALLAGTARAGDLDRMEQPPGGWTGKVFVPSFDFPSSLPSKDTDPWKQWDFRTQPEQYMASVLSYVLEGQDVNTWRVQDNPIRKWFHVPWMGPGGSGREFVNGLTRERSSRPGELGANQTKCRQNWAIGFYNPHGGYALGSVWNPVRESTGAPNLAGLPFPETTVVAKLLFTEATAEEVPLLKGAPEIQANITLDPNPQDSDCPPPTTNDVPPKPASREIKSLRLLQLDVAIRDMRADNTTGWIFGTFVYDGSASGSSSWETVRPVGLMWGNDPEVSDDAVKGGAKLQEGVILSKFGFTRDFGRAGRMNGPVDNPASACLSCHMTAQWPNPVRTMAPPLSMKWEDAKCWFRNLSPTQPFGLAPSETSNCGDFPAQGPGKSLDYSLQMGAALRNWNEEHLAEASKTFARAIDNETLVIDGVESFPVSREGGMEFTR